jgi:hypothetical protein
MNPNDDRIGERLRSYYQSIQGDAPMRLEARVSRALDAAPTPRPTRGFWKPAFGLVTVGAALVIVALVARNLGPAPIASPSAVTGTPLATPSATTSASVPPTPIIVYVTPTPAETPSPTATPAVTREVFGKTGSMTVGRDGPTATPLKDGRVLVAGGKVARGLVQERTPSAELYDPATGKFSATGSMTDARWGHTATLLRDGRVLVVGGADLSDGYDNLKSAELYDPATGKFTLTGSMAAGRADQTATLLKDGRVLVAGGTNSIGLDSAEIYNPSTGKFTPTGSMTTARQDHAATLLADGRVLVAGGTANGKVGPFGPLATAELYDPATGKFTATGSMAAPRQDAVATPLGNGRVLVAGGDAGPATSADLYDPAAGAFGPPASMATGFQPLNATTLPDGRALVVGWTLYGGGIVAELYDPATARVSQAGSLTPVAGISFGQVAALLADGRVLVLGGTQQSTNGKVPSTAAALYQP